LEKILEESVATGVVRPGLEHEDAAGAILSTIMFNAAYAPTISGTAEPRHRDQGADQMWQFVSAGILAGSGA
jgi:hypothetical protein